MYNGTIEQFILEQIEAWLDNNVLSSEDYQNILLEAEEEFDNK
jgi:hypothetical protein